MSPNCSICSLPCINDNNDPVVKCSGDCDRSFHTPCIKDDHAGTKTRSYKDWKCKDCRGISSTNSSTLSSAATAITKEFLVNIIEQFKNQITQELKTFKNDVGELTASVQFVSEKMDESTELMKQIREEIATVKKENEDLRAKNDTLTCEVTSLKDKVRTLEQYSRRNNIEISGIPVTQKEDVFTIVKDVENALGLETLDTDITAAHRVPCFEKNRTPSIIVQFLRRSSRDTWISKFKDMKGMTAHQVNPAFPKQNIYINEHLSPENKVFLSKLKLKCKEIGYNYAWCKDGKFFVRKCQGDRSRRVDNYEELNKLK